MGPWLNLFLLLFPLVLCQEVDHTGLQNQDAVLMDHDAAVEELSEALDSLSSLHDSVLNELDRCREEKTSATKTIEEQRKKINELQLLLKSCEERLQASQKQRESETTNCKLSVQLTEAECKAKVASAISNSVPAKSKCTCDKELEALNATCNLRLIQSQEKLNQAHVQLENKSSEIEMLRMDHEIVQTNLSQCDSELLNTTGCVEREREKEEKIQTCESKLQQCKRKSRNSSRVDLLSTLSPLATTTEAESESNIPVPLSRFCTGCFVRLSSNLDLIKTIQTAGPGYNDAIEQFLGKIGTVLRVDSDGDVAVTFPSSSHGFYFKPRLLTLITSAPSSDFCIGCRVRLSPDRVFVEMKQKSHGGWNDGMLQLLGRIGEVESKRPSGDIRVKIGINSFVYNPEVLTLVPEDYMTSTIDFCKGCRVKLSEDEGFVKKKLEGYGGWNEEMRKLLGKIGLVIETKPVGIQEIGVVRVKFREFRKAFYYHPDVLSSAPDPDPSDLEDKSQDFCIDCRVRLNSDKYVVIALQAGHGGWAEPMLKALGQVGVVRELDEDGDVKVDFPGLEIPRFVYNPAVFTRVGR